MRIPTVDRVREHFGLTLTTFEPDEAIVQSGAIIMVSMMDISWAGRGRSLETSKVFVI